MISAPSGAGKTTLIKKVLTLFDHLFYSVSHTTRKPRKNEQNGQDYFFICPEQFEQKIDLNFWLEWAKVHDNYYGTSRDFVETSLEKGHSLILDIDVKGAEQIMASGMDLVSIFIMAPSIDVLQQRLENRSMDSSQVIAKRLENAKSEIAQKNLYDYVVVNDDFNTALERLCWIFKKEMGKA